MFNKIYYAWGYLNLIFQYFQDSTVVYCYMNNWEYADNKITNYGDLWNYTVESRLITFTFQKGVYSIYWAASADA